MGGNGAKSKSFFINNFPSTKKSLSFFPFQFHSPSSPTIFGLTDGCRAHCDTGTSTSMCPAGIGTRVQLLLLLPGVAPASFGVLHARATAFPGALSQFVCPFLIYENNTYKFENRLRTFISL
jgi:hypothetical protein